MPSKLNPFTTEELEEMERCFNRISITLLMATAVVQQPEIFLDAKMKGVTA